MIKLYRIVSLALLLGLTFAYTTSQAQSPDKPWMIGLSYTLIDYRGPLTGEYGAFEFMDPGGTFSAHTYVNTFMDITLNSTFAPNVEYPVTQERIVTTSLIDVNAVAHFKSNGTIFEEESFFAPYIATGIGVNSASNITRVYVPASLGIRLRITDGFGINLEATYRQKFKSEDVQNMSFSGGIVFSLPTQQKKSKEEDDGIKDRDGDGVPDDVDKCPDEKGMQTYLGCPAPEEEEPEPVIDEELGTEYQFEDTDPVVDQEPVANIPVSAEDRQFLDDAKDMIFFQTGSTDLLSKSYPTLDRVADIMNRYPQINLEVAGHTDNLGTYEINQVLSVMRAYEVKYYLVKQKGIKMSRIKSDGYNSQEPIASNDTEEGRSKNRRVEFRIIE